MVEVILYEDEHFGGSSLRLQSDDSDLRNNFHWDGFLVLDNWNDETSSIAVIGGPATFYRDIDYDGPGVTLGPGVYDLSDLQARGIQNDWISSVNLLG